MLFDDAKMKGITYVTSPSGAAMKPLPAYHEAIGIPLAQVLNSYFDFQNLKRSDENGRVVCIWNWLSQISGPVAIGCVGTSYRMIVSPVARSIIF